MKHKITASRAVKQLFQKLSERNEPLIKLKSISFIIIDDQNGFD